MSLSARILNDITNQSEKALSDKSRNSLQSVVNDIINTNWSLTDDFDFVFTNPAVNIFDFIASEKNSIPAIFDKSCISTEVPTLSSAEHEVLSGGERRINVKMQELFRFSAKFRDHNSLSLRRYFMKVWAAQQYMYFDEIKSTVTINNGPVNVFSSSTILITGISPIQFDNNNSQIAEFDVSFISPFYSDVDLNQFGKNSVADKFVEDVEFSGAFADFEQL